MSHALPATPDDTSPSLHALPATSDDTNPSLHALPATSDDTCPSLHALPADCPQTNDTVDAFERFRREQIAQFEDDITEGRCFPEMPEGQFVRSK